MLPVLALAWVFQTADLQLTDGATTYPLQPVLRVAERTTPTGPPLALRRLAFVAEGAVLVAHTPTATYRLRTVAEAGLVRQTLEITDEKPRWVGEESLSWTLPGPAEALDRAYRFGLVRGVLVVGPETPVVVRWGGLALEGGAGVEGMALHGSARQAEVRLEHDHRDHHPFRVYDRCTETPENTLPARLLDLSPRQPIVPPAPRTMTWTWRIDAQVVAVPSRFPERFQAALSLTNHADQASVERTAALAYGREDWAAGRAAGEGLVGRGLRYTQTIFLAPAPGYAPQGGNPPFEALLEALQADGVELGVHSPSGRRDRPEDAEPLLAAFRARFHGVTWIDHGPADNCEALTSEGWDATSPWSMVPLLARQGFTTAWLIPDRLTGPGVNLLRPDRPAVRAPVLIHHPLLAPLRLFATAWLFGPRSGLLRRYRPSELDHLQADFGLSIGHVYLDTWRAEGPSAARTLLARGPTGLGLRPEVAVWLDDLAARQRTGTLWVTGVGPLLDHLEAALAVERRWTPGQLVVRPRAPLAGLTLLLYGGPLDGLTLNGTPAVLTSVGGRTALALPPDGGTLGLPTGAASLEIR